VGRGPTISSPHVSPTWNGFLFSRVSLMRCIAFGCGAGLVAQTSVCALFSVGFLCAGQRSKSYRLKPALLDRAGLAPRLHAMERAKGHNQILVRSSR
jgi:hypothetical protein